MQIFPVVSSQNELGLTYEALPQNIRIGFIDDLLLVFSNDCALDNPMSAVWTIGYDRATKILQSSVIVAMVNKSILGGNDTIGSPLFIDHSLYYTRNIY